MQFVASDELRPGMRLAKPIYNKNGVLLYERNSKLTLPAIQSVQNFNLIGVYILEPAEPVPPFSEEDIAFEQAQTIYMFKLRDIFQKIYKREDLDKLPDLVENVFARYGDLDHRVNFNQNLRSADDFMFKHAISTAILTAMISKHIKLSEDDRKVLICSALIYGFGYRFVHKNILSKVDGLTKVDSDIVQVSLEKGISYLDINHFAYPYFQKALTVIKAYILASSLTIKYEAPSDNILLLSEILKVAVHFDLNTGMMMGHKPQSEIQAMNYLKEHHSEFNEVIVSILAQCIHIIPAGASVDLSTGDKAVVLAENTKDYLAPIVLRLSDNSLYDLTDPNVAKRIHIVDLTKTMDNRVEIDQHTLDLFVADERLIEMTKKFKRK